MRQINLIPIFGFQMPFFKAKNNEIPNNNFSSF